MLLLLLLTLLPPPQMLIDGVTQSSLCGDSTMLGMSASVIVALLDSIQQLSNSTGVTLEHKERISGAIEDMDSQIQVLEFGTKCGLLRRNNLRKEVNKAERIYNFRVFVMVSRSFSILYSSMMLVGRTVRQ